MQSEINNQKNKKIKLLLKVNFRETKELISWLVLCVTVFAEYWPSVCWLEWYFAFVAATGTGSFVHLSWSAEISSKSAASAASKISHFVLISLFFILALNFHSKQI
jgi:hypothetical protein